MSRRKSRTSEENIETDNGMKRKVLLISAILLVAGIGGALGYHAFTGTSGIDYGNDGEGSETTGPYAPGTHMVIMELFVTGSDDCSKAESTVCSMENERSDFYFVSMVADPYNINMDVIYRFRQIGDMNGTAPDAEIDGGRRSVVGTFEESAYAEAIDESKDAPVPKTSINGNAALYGDTVLRGNLDISVNEDFSGYVRAFVLEKSSTRLFNSYGKPVPNAFMGFALNESVEIEHTSTYHRDIQWEGDKLSSENIAVLVALYDQRGYAVQAYRFGISQ